MLNAVKREDGKQVMSFGWIPSSAINQINNASDDCLGGQLVTVW